MKPSKECLAILQRLPTEQRDALRERARECGAGWMWRAGLECWSLVSWVADGQRLPPSPLDVLEVAFEFGKADFVGGYYGTGWLNRAGKKLYTAGMDYDRFYAESDCPYEAALLVMDEVGG